MYDKKTKIVATIGPASERKETLEAMIKAGMNVVRLNFSHGEHDWHSKVIGAARELSAGLETPVAIMADLQGPRIRTLVDEDLEIKNGEKIIVSDSSFNLKSEIRNPKSETDSKFPAAAGPRQGGGKIQNSKCFLLDYPGIIKDIQVGNEILIEDGLIRLKVVKKEKNFLEAEVMNGGTVKNHKGVNIPGADFRFGAITEKDRKDLEFALSKDADFVALSFVRNGKELTEAREEIKKILGRDKDLPGIIPKIETKEAIKNIDEIIAASDAVMVARGDLGINLPESEVIIRQKEIIAKCLAAAKPVIVATQMLDSMIRNPIPTRAEVSDVTNAVIDHADSVMLSGESASGKYPVESVRTLSEISSGTEKSPFDDSVPVFSGGEIAAEDLPAAASACEMAKNSGAKAIALFTESGLTARLIAHHRPEQLILAATGNPKTYRQLSLVWGVESYLFQIADSRGRVIDMLVEKAKKEKKLVTGDKAVVVLGNVPGGKELALVGIRTIE